MDIDGDLFSIAALTSLVLGACSAASVPNTGGTPVSQTKTDKPILAAALPSQTAPRPAITNDNAPTATNVSAASVEVDPFVLVTQAEAEALAGSTVIVRLIIMEIKEAVFDTGVVRINYAEIRSSGAPLVLLHGGNARWQAFESILPELAGLGHIYATDFRGQGKSSWVPGSYRLQDYANDTIVFLQRQVDEPAYLFGHSLGGMVALMVAAQAPEQVRAIAVGDAPLSSQTWQSILHQGKDRLVAWRDLSGGQKPFQQIIETLKDSPVETLNPSEPEKMRTLMGEDSPVYGWLATSLYQSDPDMLTAIIDRFDITAAGYEMAKILPAIQCPVLLLQADPTTGGLMTDVEVEQALPRLAKPTHIRLDRVSHVLQNERPDLVVKALKAFFWSSQDERTIQS